MRQRSLLLDLYAAFHKSGQIVDRAVAGTGIAPEDFAFVSIVGGRQPVTPTAISKEFGLSLSTVLFRATRNVELGFVERVDNPDDGRSFLLRLKRHVSVEETSFEESPCANGYHALRPYHEQPERDYRQ